MAPLPFGGKGAAGSEGTPEGEWSAGSGSVGGEWSAGSEGKNGGSHKMAEAGWMSPRTIDPERITVGADGWIQIRGDGQDLCRRDCRSLLVRCQPDFDFQFSFQMEWMKEEDAGMPFAGDAGVVLYYDENTYVKFGVTRDQVFAAEYVDDRYVRQETLPESFTGQCLFTVKTRGLRREFYYNNTLLWTWDRVTSICSEGLVKGKRFTGAMYGVYVNGSNLLRWRQHGEIQ